MPRVLLLIFILSGLCFVLSGQENDFMQSQLRQKHNFHLVAPKGAYVTIEVFIDDLVFKNEGAVPYDSEMKDSHKYYYKGYEDDLDSIGYVENALTFPELKGESKLKLLHIRVTVILTHKEEDYTQNLAKYIKIEDLYDSNIYVYNTGIIDIILAFW